jgi:hypothetical protein
MQPLLRAVSAADQTPRSFEIAIREAVDKRDLSVLVIPAMSP